MSELRWDPLKLHWVIIATERGRRPRDFMIEPETAEMKSRGRRPRSVAMITQSSFKGSA